MGFCNECYNFEERRDIDGNTLCAKNHRPGVSCQDFIDRYDMMRRVSGTKRHERAEEVATVLRYWRGRI